MSKLELCISIIFLENLEEKSFTRLIAKEKRKKKENYYMKNKDSKNCENERI